MLWAKVSLLNSKGASCFHLKMSFAVHCNDASEEEQPRKCRLYVADSQPQYEPTFDKWPNTPPEATPAVREGEGERERRDDGRHDSPPPFRLPRLAELSD